MSIRPSLGIALAVALSGAMSGPASLAEHRAANPSPITAEALRVFESRGRGARYWVRNNRSGKPPTTVAREKRRARKRRNVLRHKARCRA